VRARTVSRGETVTFRVDSHVVHRAISDSLSQIITMMQSCLGDTPPDLAHDVARLGITIAGGGALLHDLAQVVAESLGVEVHIAPDPDRAVINGLRYCLDDMGALHAVLRPLR
jgi:rod shape-determining protein MreB